ncbi:MAG TPA: PIG-L family deacetylase [Ilumatobacteraceae bacterium]|nr:PIG-L family deacetylase [Ilumatobacteraceae bacterium]
MYVPLHPDGLDRWGPALRTATAWSPPRLRTVCVVPHPDDEVLSMGGLIARQRSARLEVCVLAVTDGDAAYDPDGDEDLANVRRVEQDSAVAHLGLAAPIVRLGLPDGKVPEYEASLIDSIRHHIDQDCLVVAPWRKDCHPDHEAVGRAARAAAVAEGATLVSSMFWAWHYRSVKSLDSVDVLELPMSPEERADKRTAIECHHSQFDSWNGSDPILNDELLTPALWPSEYFIAEHD